MSNLELAGAEGRADGQAGRGALPRRDTWLLIFLAAGIAWRVVRFALRFPLRGDEAMLAVNLQDRTGGVTDFWRPLVYQQIAPPLFMMITQWLRQLFGSSEYVLRLVPLLAGTGGLVGLYAFARRHLAPAAGALAVVLCAVSIDPVMHAVDFKPYALDLAWGVAYVWCGWRLVEKPDSARIWGALAVIVPMAMLTSFPVIFLLPALSVVSLRAFFGRSSWRFKVAYAACQAVTLVTLYLVLRINASDQGRQTMQFMDDFWSKGFPPLPLTTVGGWVRLPVWLYQSQVRVAMGYPVAMKEILGILVTLVCGLGGLTLWRGGRWRLWLLAAPMGLTIVAACLRKYPYGVDQRLVAHLAAQVFVLAGLGFAAMCRWKVRGVHAGAWAAPVVLLALLAMAPVGMVKDYRQPYARSQQDVDAREMTPAIGQAVAPGTKIYCATPEGQVPPVLQWYLREQVPAMVFGAPPAGDAGGEGEYCALACSANVPLVTKGPLAVDAPPLKLGWECLTLLDHEFLRDVGKQRCVVYLMKRVR